MLASSPIVRNSANTGVEIARVRGRSLAFGGRVLVEQMSESLVSVILVLDLMLLEIFQHGQSS